MQRKLEVDLLMWRLYIGNKTKTLVRLNKTDITSQDTLFVFFRIYVSIMLKLAIGTTKELYS